MFQEGSGVLTHCHVFHVWKNPLLELFPLRKYVNALQSYLLGCYFSQARWENCPKYYPSCLDGPRCEKWVFGRQGMVWGCLIVWWLTRAFHLTPNVLGSKESHTKQLVSWQLKTSSQTYQQVGVLLDHLWLSGIYHWLNPLRVKPLASDCKGHQRL